MRGKVFRIIGYYLNGVCQFGFHKIDFKKNGESEPMDGLANPFQYYILIPKNQMTSIPILSLRACMLTSINLKPDIERRNRFCILETVVNF